MAKKVWKDDADFRPWESQRKRGLRAVGIGFALGVAALLLPHGDWTWPLALFAVLIFGFGGAQLRRAASRAFGKSFEAEWTAAAARDLGSEFFVRANVRVVGAGDADLAVRRVEDGLIAIVEVKSFRKWHAAFFGLFPGERETRAIQQAAGLARRTGSDASLVWLPQGRATLWQSFFPPRRGGVPVVFGGTRRLRRAILGLPKRTPERAEPAA